MRRRYRRRRCGWEIRWRSKAPTSIPIRRQSGANILIVGQNEESAIAMTALAMVSLAAQLSPTAVSFYLLDGTPADAQNLGYLPGVAAVLPHRTKVVDYRAVPQAIHEIAKEACPQNGQ